MTVYTMSVFVAEWILRGLSITGRMFVAAAFMSIYVMSTELFPTMLRSFGLGSCCMLSRIGGLASPYVADLVSDERLEVDLVRMRA